MTNFLRRFWVALRALSGDDAYERYVAHWQSHHADSGVAPLGRVAFFEQQQQRKWNSVNRCC